MPEFHNGTPATQSQKVCPFFGMIALPEMKAPSIHQMGEPEIGLKVNFNVCAEEKCAFWNPTRKDCSVKQGFEALVGIKATLDKHEAKLSMLGGLFGGKK